MRSGATCPGGELMDACYVGAGPNRSFLDIAIGPGTFWVQIDGYAGDRGIWDLDVRVLRRLRVVRSPRQIDVREVPDAMD